MQASLDGWHGDQLPVLLAASELAANAVLHAGTRYTVTVGRGADGMVRIEVTDGGGAVRPTEQIKGDERDGGWGLRIVAHVASSWGIDPHPNGKTVWVEIRPEPGNG